MLTLKSIKKLVAALAVMAMAWGILPPAMAQDLTGPTQVVNTYVASLLSGDTGQLLALMGERMQQKNRHVALSPDTYTEFLKEHYAGVQTVVETVEPAGDRVNARVRFDYPNSYSSLIEFTLDQVDGQWKVVSENEL
ncbi:MAG: hypothetical protein RQ736_15120 [Thiogranum sp.]|nr:hypothetical protein [Thiogranum sp.]